ncbi:MAG: DUF6427 family protein [Flavobacteriales bacterium]
MGKVYGYIHYSLIIIIISASVLQNGINKVGLLGRKTYYPALFYVLCTSLICFNETFSPYILGNFFFILSIKRSLLIHNLHSAKPNAYDSGLYLGIASLISPAYLLLGVALIITFAILKSTDLKEIILIIFGILTPFLYLYGWMFWNEVPFSEIYLKVGYEHDLFSNDLQLYFLILSGLLTFFGIFHFFKGFKRSTMFERRLRYVFIVLVLCMLATFFLGCGKDWYLCSLLYFTVPLSLIFSYYFTDTNWPIIASLIYYIWLFTGFFSLYVVG